MEQSGQVWKLSLERSHMAGVDQLRQDFLGHGVPYGVPDL